MKKIAIASEKKFFAGISQLLDHARQDVYRNVNTVMVKTYWQIGKRIVEQEQKGKQRADYGDYIIVNLSRYLTGKLGKGFSEPNIRNFRQFYLTFPQFATRRVANLSWSHFTRIMRLDNTKERDYYIEESSSQNWTVLELERNIRTGYYRRILSSQKGFVKDKKNKNVLTIEDLIKDPLVPVILRGTKRSGVEAQNLCVPFTYL